MARHHHPTLWTRVSGVRHHGRRGVSRQGPWPRCARPMPVAAGAGAITGRRPRVRGRPGGARRARLLVAPRVRPHELRCEDDIATLETRSRLRMLCIAVAVRAFSYGRLTVSLLAHVRPLAH